MTKAAPTDFVREAIREKASRELLLLNQRVLAFDGVERVRSAIGGVASDLAATASALASLAPDAALVGKLKRLRRSVEDAQTLAVDIADALSIAEQRAAADTARASILHALEGAGLDPEAIVRPAAE